MVARAASQLPPGYSLAWSGQYENMLRVRERLKIVVPVTLFLIFLLLYLNTKSLVEDRDRPAGRAVLGRRRGLAALPARLQHVHRRLGRHDRADGPRRRDRRLHAALPRPRLRRGASARDGCAACADLQEAIVHGAVKRVRPKLMTVAAMFMGLLPIMWSTGAGADVMKRIAAPMVGGLFTSFLLELLVYPAIYEIWKWHGLKRELALAPSREGDASILVCSSPRSWSALCTWRRLLRNARGPGHRHDVCPRSRGHEITPVHKCVKDCVGDGKTYSTPCWWVPRSIHSAMRRRRRSSRAEDEGHRPAVSEHRHPPRGPHRAGQVGESRRAVTRPWKARPPRHWPARPCRPSAVGEVHQCEWQQPTARAAPRPRRGQARRA